MTATALVLMYHRVADVAVDPWGLCVSPANFAEQLEVLRHAALPTRLQDLVCPAEHAPRRVVVTFDDAYVDNYWVAEPLLSRFEIPATIFVVPGYLGREYWWDELEALLLQPGKLPRTLNLSVNGATHEWELGEETIDRQLFFRQTTGWRAWRDAPTSRHALFFSLWQLLRPLAEPARRSILEQLRLWAGGDLAARPAQRAMSCQELASAASRSLLDLGAHTMTHPLLSSLPLDLQQQEIQESKDRLETLLDRPVATFAYPYGDYSPETLRLLHAAGFTMACTTERGLVPENPDLLRLPRFAVLDWSGTEFRDRLDSWFAGLTDA